MSKEIKEKFNEIAKKYDAQRKYLIPCFDEFYKTIVELIEPKNNRPKILDIGAGTGLLTEFVYNKFKNAKFTLIDLSDEMLNAAEKRFENKNNFEYITGDYTKYKFTEKYDTVISGLSIHHLDNNGKQEIYKNIYKALKSNGIFINGDQVSGTSEYIEKINCKNWINKIENSPLTKTEKASAYNRMKLDKMATLEDNIKFLKKACFKEVDVFYKYYNFCVFYCKK